VEIHNKLCEVRLTYKSILSEKCFETQCLLMMPYLLHFSVCVMWILFTVFDCLIRIRRASGPLFFAYHVALNNTGLLEWGTESLNLVTIRDLYLLQHIINVIPVMFSVMLVNMSFTQHCQKGTASSVTIMLSNMLTRATWIATEDDAN
jgi:hypothetical protein